MKNFILYSIVLIAIIAYSCISLQAQVSVVSGSHVSCKTHYHDQNGDGLREKVVVCEDVAPCIHREVKRLL